ncbi:phosphocholine cytidylyltransferase family protein [Desulfovibrio sp. ZJ200]|uniref:phosphocholine cytidylyltransferase family protein n=1 Tax=Desulfovibrio sp. ZJ200 TaxID=2709792 RepID=UPI0013EDDFA8|nr:phosphocholine cytidylyltransferase family protein [Desulfovibrio sp. ZJ200]
MIAVLLAAGRGSRLRELTARKPKCLVEIAGKPLLRWQCEALRGAGAARILVVRGYLSHSLTPEAAGLEAGSFETVENPRWEQSNMLSSLLCAGPWLERAFTQGENAATISYSDIVYPPEHVRALSACAEPLAVAYDLCWEQLWRLRFTDPLLDAETFRQTDGLLREIGGKPQNIAEVQGQYMGLIRVTPHGWALIRQTCAELGEAVARMDMTGFLRLLIGRGIRVGAVPVQGRWCEVDNQEDLRRYEQALRSESWPHDWRRCMVCA